MPKPYFWDPNQKKFVEKEILGDANASPIDDRLENRQPENRDTTEHVLSCAQTHEFESISKHVSDVNNGIGQMPLDSGSLINSDNNYFEQYAEQDVITNEYDEEMSLDALIESMRNESSFLSGSSSDSGHIFSNNYTSNATPKKILKLIPKVYLPHRIDAQSARAYVRRSYHDQYVLERAWYYLKQKYLSEEIFIPKSLLRPELVYAQTKPQPEKVNEKQTKQAPEKQTEQAPEKLTEQAHEKQTEEEPKVEQEREAERKQQVEQVEQAEQAEQVEQVEQAEQAEQVEQEQEGVTVYKLSNYNPKILLEDRDAESENQSYIYPMSQGGKPGMFWGAGHNDDFVRPIEAIEIFRLPSWKEEEYSLKIVFGPETYLITTVITGCAPRTINEIKPCGVELFTHDLIRIQL
jgi:hypothetical protein